MFAKPKLCVMLKIMNKRDNFYEHLAGHSDIVTLLESGDFVSAPESWYVLVTDIVASTQAIAEGNYKQVNSVNASIIAAVLNLDKQNYKSIPFSFGGDGATLLIPPELKNRARENLIQAKFLARSFGLEIRCAMIPVHSILDHGEEILVGKFLVSDNYSQAVFQGKGVELAEQWAKQDDTYEVLTESVMSKAEFNTEGFNCRWQPIKAKQGLSIAMIIRSRVGDEHYVTILHKIESIFGDRDQHHPLNLENMNFNLNLNQVLTETKVMSMNILARLVTVTRIYIENILGILKPTNSIRNNVANKRQNNLINSDYLKFDGSLKMILGGSQEQLRQFQKYLEQEFQKGSIYYGLHTSSASLITCLVFPSNDFEVHFVDGAEGGYALAALDLKKQILSNH